MSTHHPKIITLLLVLGQLLWLLQQPAFGQKQIISCTPPKWPLTVKSNEANREQLAFAKAEGDSVDKCIDWILEQVGARGGRLHAGEYIITYAISQPEGWYVPEQEGVSWYQPSAADNAHLWVFVQDASDHRIVPGLLIKAEIVNERGTSVVNKSVPFAWMPMINGYGDNIHLPAGYQYQLYLAIAPPRYHRHDPYNGDRFTRPTQALIDVKVNRAHLGEEPLSKAMEQQQSLARAAGNAYKNTLKAMYKQATAGKDTLKGDYFVAFADEYGEGYWHYNKNKKFTYMISNEQSAVTNAHVEVVVCDARTGRFLHDLAVQATLFYKDSELGTREEPFMWHPWLYHYGENWRVPRTGRKYSLHIHVKPPAYRRYGKLYGKQFTHPVDVEFNNILIKTGER